MNEKTKNIAGSISLVLIVIVVVLPLVPISDNGMTLLGIVAAITAALAWGVEAGVAVSLLLIAIYLNSLEAILFGVLAVTAIALILFKLKMTAKKLKKHQERYLQLTSSLPGAIYSQEANNKIFINGQFEDVVGHKADDFITGKRKIHDVIHPNDWAKVRGAIREKIEKREPWDIEYRVITADDKVRWVNEKGRVILGKGKDYLLEAIIIDISPKKETEKALKQSEEKYRDLVERANDGIAIVKDGMIKYVNPRVSDILSCPRSDIIGRKFEDYLVEEEREAFKKKCSESAQDGKKLICDTILRSARGRRIHAEISSGVINYEKGVADLLIIRDVSLRTQIEEIIHQKDQEFKNLVEGSPDIIARFDSGHRYLYINPAIKGETGSDPKEFFWKTPSEIGFSENESKIWEDAIDLVFETKKEKAIYTEQTTLSGKRYYYTRILPEFNKDREVRTVLAISRDITEAKEIDKVKSEFIAVSSHQLRTPLSVIRWCTVMFLDGMLGEITQEQREYMDKIYGSTKKLIKISNAFFNAAILDLGILNVMPKRMDLIEAIKESIKGVEVERSEKEVKINERYEKDVLMIDADRRILRTVLKSLLSNAIKYGYQGGNIWVDVKQQESSVLIRIADDGRGIPAREHPKIFTKFFRADNVRNEELYGTGLDLYIIKEMVNNFGGVVWFESPNLELKDKGTAFYFTIPLTGMKKRGGL